MGVRQVGLGIVVGIVGACTPVRTPDPDAERAGMRRIEDPDREQRPTPRPRPWAEEGDEPWRICARNPCVAGLFRALNPESRRDDDGVFEERIASAPGHPNLDMPVSGHVGTHDIEPFEPGERFWLIAWVGKHDALHAVFAAPPTAEGRAEVEAIFTAPEVLLNDPASRTMWRTLARERDYRSPSDPPVMAWASSHDGRIVVFAREEDALLYDLGSDSRLRIDLEVGDRVTNVTFEGGRFWLWDRLSLVGSIPAPEYAVAFGSPIALDRETLAPESLRALHEGFLEAAAQQENQPEPPAVWGTNADHTRLYTRSFSFHLPSAWFGWILIASSIPHVDNITVREDNPTWWHDGRPLDPVW